MVRLLLLLLLVWRIVRVAALVVAGWIGWELMPDTARAPVHQTVVLPAASWLQSTGSRVGEWVDDRAPWLVEAVTGGGASAVPAVVPAGAPRLRALVDPKVDRLDPRIDPAPLPSPSHPRGFGDVLRDERRHFVDIMRQPIDSNLPR